MKSVFPKCPICDSGVGYYISGVFQKYAQCQSCKSKWKLHFSKSMLTGLMLHELPKNGQGLYRVNGTNAPLYETMGKEHPTDFWSKLKLGNQIDWEYLGRHIDSDAVTAVILGKGEKSLASWSGLKWFKVLTTLAGTTQYDDVFENGILLLTNRRLLWIKKSVTDKGVFFASIKTSVLVKNEIPLEEVKGISATSGDSEKLRSLVDVHIVDGKDEHTFQLYYAFPELLKPTVESAISIRQVEIEQEKKQDKMHVMLDFSFLKKYMEDGGLVMQTLKCPECGAPVKFPETGSQTVCVNCGANIYANDIFKKIRELIG